MTKEKMKTIGIDLGTSTTQLVISELTIENFASAFSVPRIRISKKEVIYRSDIIFTPLKNQTEIDELPIKEFVTQQYQKAGIKKEEIQMGAVIITGESARKTNASAVLNALSDYAGDFVVATAGPDLESIIAGKGAGSEALSRGQKGVIANLDIGGGTSNLVSFEHEEIVSTGCFDIGGRLIKLDAKGKITYIAPKILTIIQKENLSLKLGENASEQELKRVVQLLVEVLENSVGIGEKSPYFDLLVTNHAMSIPRTIEKVTFSGGVADCIYGKEEDISVFQFGDIGVLLGRALLKSRIFQEKKVVETQETIRATVVGAGSHTADVSGSTIAYEKKILPIKNIPVLKLSTQDERNMKEALQEKLQWFSSQGELPNVALSFTGLQNPKFQDIQYFAESIVQGAQKLIAQRLPLIVVCEKDMAKALGHSLFQFLPENYPYVAIDSVQVENGDYIDIGNPVANGQALPVIVKTLVFSE